MRSNLPVTQKERALEPGRILLSKTDLSSRIVFVNNAFVAASGFDESELLGQPHNLVRHPDVPSPVFADLWQTIKGGRLWNGIVKNRAQNGDHYWVSANVTPIFSNGAITGFTSVRTPATREEIVAAEAAYAAVRRNPKAAARLLHPGASYRSLMRWGAVTSVVALLAAGASLAFAAPVAAACAMAVAAGGVIAVAWGGLDLIGQVAHCEDQMMRIQADGAVHRRLPGMRSREVNDLSRSFNALMSGFQAMAGDIQRSSQELQTALSGLAQSNQQIRDSSEHQTQATETTAAAVEEMTVSIGEVAHRTTETAHVGREALELAASGNKVAEQASQEIDLIAKAIGESAAKLDELGQRSSDIARIVGVIREIADQTNLLALNAAIEAARAGEQGRGFAVVADEVRKLAQRTAQATTEITDVTEVIQTGTSTAVSAMHTSVDRVHRGVQLTRDAAAALANIQKGADQTATALGEVESATREQGIASAEIAQQVERISQMTAKNNDALQQNLAVFSDLERLSRELSDAANRFRSDGR